MKPLLKKKHPSLEKRHIKTTGCFKSSLHWQNYWTCCHRANRESFVHLHEHLQSAYTHNHSTEAALVQGYQWYSVCVWQHSVFTLFSLIWVGHFGPQLIIRSFILCFEEDYGITGSVAEWMKILSFWLFVRWLTLMEQNLNEIRLNYGFPQGSKIGPFGFKLYTKPLTSIVKSHNIQIYLYADDTQLYCSFDPSASQSAMQRMESCITEIRIVDEWQFPQT